MKRFHEITPTESRSINGGVGPLLLAFFAGAGSLAGAGFAQGIAKNDYEIGAIIKDTVNNYKP